ncbi:hypothetical protein [Eilatimonas milleporae]|uniref:Response regulator receiver domain-containing protein n=1 Tax=Eilatimonas milleporae TaxID=911205 RepID=A0A3M0D7N5_9PROT|nr:hypothetical protein [Eilatimonas milleporae]RMB12283.1 hypothetical protein BXY39_0776 [Eilatimonas milleporae]
MTKPRKLLILDDDHHYSGMLALKLRHHFPELRVSSSNHSRIRPGYDIYVLDNDFSGDKIGARLAEEARATAPDSLVVVLSGTLEFGLLKRLVNCHAAGVFDKSDPSEIGRMKSLIEGFLVAGPAPASEKPAASIGATVSGIAGLISEWNKRLAFEKGR